MRGNQAESVMRPFLRIFLIMIVSFSVVLAGTLAVGETSIPEEDRNGAWLLVFTLLAVTLALGTILRRSKDGR